MISVEVTGHDDVISSIGKFMKNVESNEQRLNTKRGEKFRFRTRAATKLDKLGLTPIAPATIARRRQNLGGPMFDTGELTKAIKIHENEDNSTDVGYFEDDTEVHSGTNPELTNYQLALIHSNRPFLLNSAVAWEKEIIDKEISEKWIKEQIEKSNV